MDTPTTDRLFPLTNPQMGIWNTEKTHPGTSIGVIAATEKIRGDIDYPTLERAINLFIERNEGLRLRFTVRDGDPRQYLAPYAWHPIDFVDFTGRNTAELFQWDNDLTGVPFALTDTELFYFAMFKLSDKEGGYYIKIHHLLSDAWSFIQLGNQIMGYYHSLRRSLPIRPDRVTSYLEYAESEQEYFQSDRFVKDKAYWNGKFANLPDFTTLKTQGAGCIGTRARRKTFVLPHKLSLKIQEHCFQNKTSPFSLFLASLAIYINRVTGKDDIIVGTPVLNRTNFREKETIGMFISTVPIRIGLGEGAMDFRSFYGTISKEWMEILRHQKYPYDQLLKDVRETHKGTESLYDIVLSYQNARFDHNEDDEVEHEGRWHFNGHQKPSLTIHINDREGSGDLVIDYDYRDSLYYAKEIEFIHDHIIRILWHALDNPARAISRIEMISEREKHRLIHEFNDTCADYPKQATIHGLFEAQAARWPDRVAVTCGRDSLTYRGLDGWANRLAWNLRERGAGPDRIIALYLHRSNAMLAAILGVLKSGGAYLPIDPDYPEDRIRYILEDSGANLMVTDQPQSVPFEGTVLDIRDFAADPPAGDGKAGAVPPPDISSPHDLAYIIYTSGSTGRPKGAMIEHRNVVRLLVNDRFQFSFSETDVWSMFHSYCFDFSVWEMYGALLYGGRLVVIPNDAARDTRRFLRILEDERVTVLNQTPAAFYNLINEDLQQVVSRLSLRYVVFGGEALKPLLLKPFRARHPETRLINMYGITETTVHVTYKEIGDEEIDRNLANIGRAIPTLKTYIMDKNLTLLPIGVPGELCVSGDGVGRGYLNNPELTAQKFVANPYMPGEVLYRSGDLARLYALGDIEYLGRIDSQVKIRGHRIELGEVESTILRHDAVKEVTVLTRENQLGTRQLCAYYVPGGDIDPAGLKRYLSKCLPDYMIPSYLIPVDVMPLTGNGKVDRARLPLPEASAEAEVAYAAPETPLQREIVQVWAEILEIDSDAIGVDNDFLLLGGDSLSAIRVVARLDGGLAVSDLYDAPTIRQLAVRVQQLRDAGTPAMPAAMSSDVPAPAELPAAADLLRRLTGPRGAASRMLVCFPYGGGTATNFMSLANAIRDISPDTAVYAVAPQGHDFGRSEPFQPLEETARRVADEILRKVRGPLILYAHCVGTALATETVRLLEREKVRIDGFFSGGILPPRIPGLFGRPFNPWKPFSDRSVVSLLHRIGLPDIQVNPAFTRFAMRVFRQDVADFYRYFHSCIRGNRTPIATPVQILIGDNDPMTRRFKARQHAWSRYAVKYSLAVLPQAGHYFTHSHPERVAVLLLGITSKHQRSVRTLGHAVTERSAVGGS